MSISDTTMPELPAYQDTVNRRTTSKGVTIVYYPPDQVHAYARQYAAPIEAERDAMRAALKNIEIKAHLAATMCDNDARAKGFVILESLARAALTPTTKEPSVKPSSQHSGADTATVKYDANGQPRLRVPPSEWS